MIALPWTLAAQGLASNSALDFAKFIYGPPTQAGNAFLSDSDGNLYAVGTTADPADFPVTAGALAIPPRLSPVAFVQKLSSDGSQVLASALLAEVYPPGFPGGGLVAKTDASGNLYIVFPLRGQVATTPSLKGDSTGDVVLLKVNSGLNKVLNASRVPIYSTGDGLGLAISPDGSAYVGGGDYEKVQIVKFDPSGNLTNYSTTLTDSHEAGHSTYDGMSVRLSLLPDKSLLVMASPSFLYRIDPSGTSVLAHTNVGNGNVELFDLASDSSGNAYVAGATTTNYSEASRQIGYVNSLNGKVNPPALIAKIDASGSLLYSDLFDLRMVACIASDSSGKVWAAGQSSSGFTLFQLDADGAGFLHYSSLLASFGDNGLGMLALDAQGRALIAGSTPAREFPGYNRRQYANSANGDSNLNALFLRTNQNSPQTDLQVDVNASPTAVTANQSVTFTVRITNLGPVSASDVFLQVPDYAQPNAPGGGIVACRASTGGTCDQSDSYWFISFPQVQVGASVSVDVQYPVSNTASFSTMSLPFLARTSTDDVDQLNNYGEQDVALQPSVLNLDLSVDGYPRAPVIPVYVAGAGQIYVGCYSGGFGCVNALPVAAGSAGRVYIPTPLWLDSLYEFKGWADGSTDNPRTFAAGAPSSTALLGRVTYPWVDPDMGIVNSSSYRTGAVSPGEVIALFGVNLGPAIPQTAQLDFQGRLATNVSGFSVMFDGTPAPVVYTSSSQSAVIVPYSVAGKSTSQMTIHYQETVSKPMAIVIASTAPGLYSATTSGSGLLAAWNGDGSLNSRANPISRGDVVVLYATGEGLTNPTPMDGEIAGSNPPTPQLPVTVSIGGQTAEILYKGGVPTVTAGLMQLNVRVPQSLQPGLLPVRLTVGTRFSQTGVTLAVR